MATGGRLPCRFWNFKPGKRQSFHATVKSHRFGAGDCRIVQGSSEIVLRPGEIGLFDGAEEFEIDHSRSSAIAVDSLLIPKSELRAREIDLPAGAAAKLSQHDVFGQLLCESACSFASSIEHAAPDDVSELYNLLLYLTSKATDLRGFKPSPPMRADANFHRITRLVRNNSTNENYSIADCAAEVGLSIGNIRNLFTSKKDSFGKYLLRHRLG